MEAIERLVRFDAVPVDQETVESGRLGVGVVHLRGRPETTLVQQGSEGHGLIVLDQGLGPRQLRLSRDEAGAAEVARGALHDGRGGLPATELAGQHVDHLVMRRPAHGGDDPIFDPGTPGGRAGAQEGAHRLGGIAFVVVDAPIQRNAEA